jgi:energy-coupling factor transporter transmembrane protein EcfT
MEIAIIIWIITIVINLISKEEISKITYLTTSIVLIVSLILFTIQTNKLNEQQDYIQNLEEKVNILTVDYEEYSLEDSLRQVE